MDTKKIHRNNNNTGILIIPIINKEQNPIEEMRTLSTRMKVLLMENMTSTITNLEIFHN